jgi:hypothetical protein
MTKFQIEKSTGVVDKVTLGNTPTQSLFGASGIQLYQGINSLFQPSYVQSFVDGAIIANAVDPLNKMDEVIAMLLLALLLHNNNS